MVEVGVGLASRASQGVAHQTIAAALGAYPQLVFEALGAAAQTGTDVGYQPIQAGLASIVGSVAGGARRTAKGTLVAISIVGGRAVRCAG